MATRLHRAAGALAAGILLLLLGCSHGTNATSPAVEPKPSAPAVRYVKVVQQDVPETLDLVGKLQPDPTKVVRIFPPASGRVVSLAVKPGDHVHAGEVIAILSSSDVASAQSDYAKASIEAERATRETERQKVLFEHGAAAEKDYIEARAQADTAEAELARTKQRLNLLDVSPSATTDRVKLTAPASGVVVDVSAAPGEFSKSLESANPLVTIADLNTVWMIGDVYEKDLAKVSLGTPVVVTLQAFPGRQWNGHIDSLAGMLDPTTRTLKTRVVLANPAQELRPEMFGSIRLNAGSHPALIVPTNSIIREGGTATVFVKTAGKPEQRTVTVGPTVDGRIEVLSGLHAGEEVAADGAELLKEGPGD